jgi:NDP-sugar pyrophosphorylase family protein
MKAAIIAAGTGERLARGGVLTPKPLVPICGEPMISRVIRASSRVNATSIACVVNDVNPEVASYLRSRRWPVPLELVVKTTPNSMESLFALAPILKDEPFLLLTVDAVFGFSALGEFLADARELVHAQGVLGLTSFVEDEKPLWVGLAEDRRITALGDGARPTPYVTAGFYYLSPELFAVMDVARAKRLAAFRQFLGLLLETGFSLYGVPGPKSVDVDRPEDIQRAEAFLREMCEQRGS